MLKQGRAQHAIDAMSSDDFSFSAASPSQSKQEEPAAAAASETAPAAPRHLLVPVDDSEVWPPRESCHWHRPYFVSTDSCCVMGLPRMDPPHEPSLPKALAPGS